MLQCTHANIYKLIEALKKEQTLVEVKHEQSLAEEPPAKRRCKYKDVAERLRNVVASYDEDNDPMQFLRAVAHNIS